MYKNTMRSQMRISRTGSHATMPAATGRIDLMPAWAQEPEEYYNTLREQFALLVEYMQALQEKIEPFTVALKRPLRRDEYEAVREVHGEYGHLIHIVNEQLAALRPLVRAADHASRDALSFHLAKNFLDPGTLQRIDTMMTRLIHDWRPRPTLTKGASDQTELQREAENKKTHKRDQRRKSRNQREFWSEKGFSLAGKRALRADEQARDKEHHRHVSQVAREVKAGREILGQQQGERDVMETKLAALKEHFR